MICVKVRGRTVTAQVQPMSRGYFLRTHVYEVFGIQPGSILEVDGRSCIVKYLIAGDPGDPEVWAILLSVARQPEGSSIASPIDPAPPHGRIEALARSLRTRFSFPPGT